MRKDYLPVYASDKDQCKGYRDGIDEHTELPVAIQGNRTWSGLGCPDPPLHPQPVIRRGEPKEGKDHHLQTDSRNDGTVAGLQQIGLVGACTGGDGATNGLNKQARDIGGDEDVGVLGRRDSRKGRVERQADVFEGDVDGDADERRA